MTMLIGTCVWETMIMTMEITMIIVDHTCGKGDYYAKKTSFDTCIISCMCLEKSCKSSFDRTFDGSLL